MWIDFFCCDYSAECEGVGAVDTDRAWSSRCCWICGGMTATAASRRDGLIGAACLTRCCEMN